MWIILTWVVGVESTAYLMTSGAGALTFDTEEQAEQYAKDNCAWAYRVIQLIVD